MDPQQRMALELTWEAARIPASSLRGGSVGVYVGSSTNDYSYLAVMDHAPRTPTHHRHRQFDHRQPGVVFLRLPRPVGIGGHGLLVITGRRTPGRSGAAQRRGRCSGHAGRSPGHPRRDLPGFDEVGRVLAADGRIKSFVLDADGYAQLRRRRHAGAQTPRGRASRRRQDHRGDHAGSAVNHDGRSNGMLAPNPGRRPGVAQGLPGRRDQPPHPSTTSGYGTGTILGDPIEADALGRVIGRGRSADQPHCSARSSPMSATWSRRPARPAWPRWRCR